MDRRHRRPAAARDRGLPVELPHHVLLRLDSGGAAAKQQLYRASVQAALADLAGAVRDGRPVLTGAQDGVDTVALGVTASHAAHTGRTLLVPPIQDVPARPPRTAPSPSEVLA